MLALDADLVIVDTLRPGRPEGVKADLAGRLMIGVTARTIGAPDPDLDAAPVGEPDLGRHHRRPVDEQELGGGVELKDRGPGTGGLVVVAGCEGPDVGRALERVRSRCDGGVGGFLRVGRISAAM